MSITQQTATAFGDALRTEKAGLEAAQTDFVKRIALDKRQAATAIKQLFYLQKHLINLESMTGPSTALAFSKASFDGVKADLNKRAAGNAALTAHVSALDQRVANSLNHAYFSRTEGKTGARSSTDSSAIVLTDGTAIDRYVVTASDLTTLKEDLKVYLGFVTYLSNNARRSQGSIRDYKPRNAPQARFARLTQQGQTAYTNLLQGMGAANFQINFDNVHNYLSDKAISAKAEVNGTNPKKTSYNAQAAALSAVRGFQAVPATIFNDLAQVGNQIGAFRTASLDTLVNIYVKAMQQNSGLQTAFAAAAQAVGIRNPNDALRFGGLPLSRAMRQNMDKAMNEQLRAGGADVSSQGVHDALVMYNKCGKYDLEQRKIDAHRATLKKDGKPRSQTARASSPLGGKHAVSRGLKIEDVKRAVTVFSGLYAGSKKKN